MQAYEIYDASTVALYAERDRLRAIIMSSKSDTSNNGESWNAFGSRPENLLEMILEELDERAASDAVFSECCSAFTNNETELGSNGSEDGTSEAKEMIEDVSAAQQDKNCTRHIATTDDSIGIMSLSTSVDQTGEVSDSRVGGVHETLIGATRQSSPGGHLQKDEEEVITEEHISNETLDEETETVETNQNHEPGPSERRLSVVEAAKAAFKAEKRATRRASIMTAEVKGIVKREEAMQQARKRSFAGRKALQEEFFMPKKVFDQHTPASVPKSCLDVKETKEPKSCQQNGLRRSNDFKIRSLLAPDVQVSDEVVQEKTRRSLSFKSAADNDNFGGSPSKDEHEFSESSHLQNGAADEMDKENNHDFGRVEGQLCSCNSIRIDKEAVTQAIVSNHIDRLHVIKASEKGIGESTNAHTTSASTEDNCTASLAFTEIDDDSSKDLSNTHICDGSRSQSVNIESNKGDFDRDLASFEEPVREMDSMNITHDDHEEDGSNGDSSFANDEWGSKDRHEPQHFTKEDQDQPDDITIIDYNRQLLSDDEFEGDDDPSTDYCDDGDGYVFRHSQDECVDNEAIPSPTTKIRRYFAHDDSDGPSLSSMLRGRQDKDMCAWGNSRPSSPDLYGDSNSETLFGDHVIAANDDMLEIEASNLFESIDASKSGKDNDVNEESTSESLMTVKSFKLEEDVLGMRISYTEYYYSKFEDVFSSVNIIGTKPQQQLDKRPCSSDGQNLFKHHISRLDEWLKNSNIENCSYCLNPNASESSKKVSANSLVFYIPQRNNSSHSEFSKTVKSSFSSIHWHEQPASTSHCWNILWSWSTRLGVSTSDLYAWQFVNHFPNARNLTRKDLLSGHLQRHMAVHGTTSSASLLSHSKKTSIFNIVPQTFALPKDYNVLCEVMAERQIDIELEKQKDDFHQKGEMSSNASERGTSRTQPDVNDNIWIMKPIGSSRGRGIFLVDDISTVSFSEPMIIQKYISNPLLLKGFKFDLRLYVLVTSFKPLECWISRLGFARFASKPFTCTPDALSDNLVHLTNSSIQKDFEDHSVTDKLESIIGDDGRGGTKASLSDAFLALQKEKPDFDSEALWKRIRSIVLTSLFSVEDSMAHSPNCFELFGYDVLVDDIMRPWLIEVNSSPQLDVPTKLDETIKQKVLCDVISVLQPVSFCRTKLRDVLARRLASSGKRAAQTCTKGITMAEERNLVNEDVYRILHGKCPRRYGEMPEDPGDFERLAPSSDYDGLCRMKKRIFE